MLKTTSPLAVTKAKRGFGLIDVSLGIIAGIGLLVGAVILFQQVSTNNAVSEVTRNSVSISSEIRAAARNLESFDVLHNATTPAAGAIDLERFGMEPAILNNPDVAAASDDQEFTLAFSGLSQRACDRAAVAPSNLGTNVESAACATVDDAPVLNVRFAR